jgi:hypothetical protein
MKNKKQDKQLEKLLFEVYDKGVKQQDCNLTEYIEKVKQALRIHNVVGRSEQLICNTCKSGLIDYPEINRRTCRCGGLGYNVKD